ncbi:MarR family winged helix-turn-helix transcriptional regulator [Aquimarina sp. RZ0]|uniref:MarR family winged helix-turn-helix transcriptional regulator n=1 Tax=Aquimarina sp. RZ0 TaxID=2607730 RepID=UPI0011F38549|nr:MarR family winged helix-turn-helix transcriptional regulator [Aquimarina sp. RZ0]KAA1243004.1 winged helix-turn-helix transcriptional regulator [Aquimarina sp. RZ0]
MDPDFFNILSQQQDISNKIIIGLERISEAFKSLLRDHAKTIGLSPIQIQILIFIAYHKEDLCKVSYLANEFNVTKPTISDAVKILEKKEMIFKTKASADSRSYYISLTDTGKKAVLETESFATPIKKQLSNFNLEEQESLLKTITTLIFKLNQTGILTIQRTCYNCKFYEKSKSNHYCNLMQTALRDTEIRLDCPEFQKLN